MNGPGRLNTAINVYDISNCVRQDANNNEGGEDRQVAVQKNVMAILREELRKHTRAPRYPSGCLSHTHEPNGQATMSV